MNRIDRLFRVLQEKNKTALMPFLVAGDPTLAHTRDLIVTLEQAGADMIELGVPFSDPIADGPTIQAAGQRDCKRFTDERCPSALSFSEFCH